MESVYERLVEILKIFQLLDTRIKKIFETKKLYINLFLIHSVLIITIKHCYRILNITPVQDKSTLTKMEIFWF